MTGRLRSALVNVLLWGVVPLAVLAILRPWTVRPLERSKPASFDAAAYAASAWPRLLQEAAQTAIDVSEIGKPGTPPPSNARFVKGTGVVTAVDRRSRVGVVRVRLASAGSPAVAIQIGPVIRGSALRDASSFIRFSDFTNQFDYAGAANALNDSTLRTVVGGLALDKVEGRTVAFIGAIGKSPVRDDGALEIVPVQIEIVEAAGK